MYIIADVGSNWSDKDDCLSSVFYAFKAGAHAVKFQYFNHEKLFGYKGKMAHCLSKDWLPLLRNKAINHGIDFMVTPFSHKDIKMLNPYVDKWKIASSDLTYFPLLEAVKETGKPIIMSTGASRPKDIEMAMKVLGNHDVTLLYCVSDYPSIEDDIFHLRHLSETYGVPVGYSDHTTQIFSGILLCELLGGIVYEKHFKIQDMKSPDNDHSLDYINFSRMVVRYEHGFNPDRVNNLGETNMHRYHNRRLVVTKSIKRGDVLVYGFNFGYYRTVVKCEGDYLVDKDAIDGRLAKRFLPSGMSICKGDYE